MLLPALVAFFLVQALLMAFIVYDGRVNQRRLNQILALRARVAQLERRTCA